MVENNIIKCIAIGDGFVGKTSLLTRLTRNEYDEKNYIPTIFDNSSLEISHNGKTYDLHLLDTAGQEEYEHLRTQIYSNADIFLVCFSVTNINSFTNVKELWIPEVKKYAEEASLILIGTKSDLRRDPETIDRMNISQEFFVSKLAAENLASIYNTKYIECSARTKENLEEIINVIVSVQETKSKFYFQQIFCTNPFINLVKRTFCCRHY